MFKLTKSEMLRIVNELSSTTNGLINLNIFNYEFYLCKVKSKHLTYRFIAKKRTKVVIEGSDYEVVKYNMVVYELHMPYISKW